MQRVVVSGYGVNSCYGFGADALRDGLKSGRSGVKRLEELAAYKGLHSLIGAVVDDVEAQIKSIPRKYRRSMGRIAQLAALAANEAKESSGLTEEIITGPRTGCIMGSTMGSARTLDEVFKTIIKENNLAEVSGMEFFKCVSHTVAMNCAQMLGISGCILSPSSACASSLQATGLGIQMIRSGMMDVVFCGGAEELNALVVGTFDSLMAASSKYNDEPEKTPRPFDAARDGLVCGEGAGVLVLESLDHALARGATIYAELTGYSTCGNSSHISQSDTVSIGRCIRQALDDAGVAPESIDYVCAHATATMQGDAAEAQAIAETIGAEVPVSSLKGGIGHTLGASGAIELIATMLMMQEDLIYPTVNLTQVAEECTGINHVSKPLEKHIDVFLKNCFAFGGINAVVVGKRYDS